jgi:hypothetical protein
MRSLLLVMALSAAASADVPTALGPPTPLLGDRLAARLPVGMKLEARPHDIMAADTSNEDETRGVIDVGSTRFVMMTYEMYATASASPQADVEADIKHDPIFATAKVETVAIAKPLVAFGARPAVPAKPDVGNLVYEAYVISDDRTIQVMAFYVGPDGMHDFARWGDLGKRIVATTTAGKRPHVSAAGDRALGPHLTVSVGAGWLASTQPGPDFDVYHLRKLAPLGANTPGCGVYVGDAASFQWKQSGIDAKDVTSIPGKLLGSAVTWNQWTGRDVVIEAMTTLASHQTVHVFCSAAAVADLKDLRAMMETLRAH